MSSSIDSAISPLAFLGDLAERQFVSPQASILATLDVARSLTGHRAALLAARNDDAWIVEAICGDAFGLAPGDSLPLDELLSAGRLDATPGAVADARRQRPADDREPAAIWSSVGAATITPAPPGADPGAAVLCTFDERASPAGAGAADALRVLARFLAADRTQAAAATRLEEQDAQLVAAFDDAPIGMALVALDGRWLRVNPALCRIVGRSEEELLAGAFQDITHPDDLDADIDHRGKMLDGAIRSYQAEKRYLHAAGHVVWIRLDVSLVRDASGQPRCFVSQIQDITEQRRHEAALASGDARLRLALAAASMAAWDWDVVTGEVYRSEEMPSLYGLPAEALSSDPGRYLSFAHPDDRPRIDAADRQLFAGDRAYEVEYRVVWPDGQIRWLRERGEAIRDHDGRLTRVLGITQDITDRLQAEAAIVAERDVLTALLEQLPDPVYVKDTALRFVRFNQATADTLGVAHAEEAIGKTDFDFFAATLATQFAAEERAVLAGEPLRNKLQRESWGDDARWVLTSKSPLRDAAGATTGLIGI
ncbi:MAG TPA: PAS domain S-box protein, partial [Thermomicrobiales bacterium]|nr:PAS domain S-box protein [Thermomicrobiales bacterium]